MYNFVNAHQGLNSATVVKIDPCNLRFIQAVQVLEPRWLPVGIILGRVEIFVFWCLETWVSVCMSCQRDW